MKRTIAILMTKMMVITLTILTTMVMTMVMMIGLVERKMSIKKPNRSKLRSNLVPAGDSDNIQYQRWMTNVMMVMMRMMARNAMRSNIIVQS